MNAREFLLLCIAAVAIAYWNPVNAAPVAAAQSNGATITLFEEPCALDAVSNLPRRATWSEGGQVFEGCYQVHPAGVIVMYFAGDKTVALAPMSAFRKLSAT